MKIIYDVCIRTLAGGRPSRPQPVEHIVASFATREAAEKCAQAEERNQTNDIGDVEADIWINRNPA